LNTDKQPAELYSTYCDKCGYPLTDIKTAENISNEKSHRPKNSLENTTDKPRCPLCTREKIFNIILIGSYILSAGLFIAFFVGVILDQVSLDICILIGCLELIFLFLLGRFLEKVVFIGLSLRNKIVAGFYRFSLSGDLQAYEIAMDQFQKISEDKMNEQLWFSLFQMLGLQASNLSFYWWTDLKKTLNLPLSAIQSKISYSISISKPEHNKKLLSSLSPAGLGFLIQLALKTKNYDLMNLLFSKIAKICESEKVERTWSQEFFIHQDLYLRVFKEYSKDDFKDCLESLVDGFNAPKPPTVDVVAQGRKFFRHPLIRYAIRIIFYILLAFLLSLLYQLLD
jgi:hypothetical protein